MLDSIIVRNFSILNEYKKPKAKTSVEFGKSHIVTWPENSISQVKIHK